MIRIHHADYHKFAVDGGNRLSFESVWRVSATPPPDNAVFLAEVRNWAGAAGDPFRIGGPDGSPVALDGVAVESLDIEFPAAGEAVIRFRATGIGLGEAPEHLSETLGSDGERRKKATFRIAAAPGALPPLPAIGAVLSWAGESFVCESAESKSVAGGFECTINCRKIGTRLLRGPELVRDADSEETESATYFVPAANHAAMLAAFAIDVPVPWGSPEKVIRKVTSRSSGPLGFEVTVEGRKIVTKMLESRRSERFDGFDSGNRIRRELIWQSRWRVRADELADFENLTGAPAVWAGADTVVTEVIPRRISELEYELAIEAQALTNPNLYRNYSEDDRSNLQGRTDVNARLIDFLITPEMAGYLRSDNGAYVTNPDFSAATASPFAVTEPLGVDMVNAVIKTILLTETGYRPGPIRNHLDDMIDWAYAGRVTTDRVAGCSGSFLKVDLELRELADNFGNRWTRITASYQMAPPEMPWNPVYWNNK
ncbi:MAG: hypothetical protein AB7F32_13080 [Victivallaceae bacterium]